MVQITDLSPAKILFIRQGRWIGSCREGVYLEAHMVFEWYDFEHSTDEDRYIAIGMVGDVLFVVFTERSERIRIISARLATEAERRLYYDRKSRY
jgi:uncharacterized DUF497 family protein